jgi:hypothetical protein
MQKKDRKPLTFLIKKYIFAARKTESFSKIY